MKKIVILAAAMLAVALINPRPASAQQTDAGTPSDGSAVSPPATPQALASGTGCVAPAGEPSCQQWVVLTRCLASEAAAQAATCTDLSGRAQEAARRAIVACRGQSTELAELRAQLATVTGERDACVAREQARAPETRRRPDSRGRIWFPNCLGQGDEAGLRCLVGGRVLMGDACHHARTRVTETWCACPSGTRAVAVRRTRDSDGARLAGGFICAVTSLAGVSSQVPQPVVNADPSLASYEARLTSIERWVCRLPDRSEIDCEEAMQRRDRLIAAAGRGERNLDEEEAFIALQNRVAALEAIVADHRRQIGGIQSVLAVPLCGLRPGEIATVENCRPATGGGGSRRPVIHAVRLGVEGSLRFSGHLTPFGTVGYGVVLPVGGSDNLLLGIDGILGSYGATGTGAIWGFALRFGWEHAVSPSVSLGLGSRFVLFQDFGNQNRAEEAIGNYRGFSVTVGPTATFGLGAGFTFQVSAGIGYHRSVVFHPDPVRGASEPGSWGVNLNGALERRF